MIPDKLIGLEAAKLTEIGEYQFEQRGCSRLCVEASFRIEFDVCKVIEVCKMCDLISCQRLTDGIQIDIVIEYLRSCIIISRLKLMSTVLL